MLSPVVFNAKFFSANYHSKEALSQAEAQTDWIKSLDDTKYPNCKQGSSAFNANTYYRANTKSISSMEGTPGCAYLVKHYLRQGIYDGLQTYSAKAEHTARMTI